MSARERNDLLMRYCNTSVIKAALYKPDPYFREIEHVAVALDGKPFIFCGELESPSAYRQAMQLAGCEALAHIVRTLGLGRDLSVAEIAKHHPFEGTYTAVAPNSSSLQEDQEDGTTTDMLVFFTCLASPQVVQLLCMDDEIGALLATDKWVATGFNLADHLLSNTRATA